MATEGSGSEQDYTLTPEDRDDLLKTCAELYSDVSSIYALLERIGYPPSRLASLSAAGPPYNVWIQIFEQLDREGLGQRYYPRLVSTMLRAYAAHPTLVRLGRSYGLATTGEPVGTFLVVRASTEDERQRAAAVLSERGLEPVEQFSTAHVISFQVRSSTRDEVARLLDGTGLGWTLAPSGTPDYLLAALRIEGPDGRTYQLTNVLVAISLRELLAQVLDLHQEEPRIGDPVAELVTAAGARRLDLDSSLLDEGVEEGAHIRFSWELASQPLVTSDALVADPFWDPLLVQPTAMVGREELVAEVAAEIVNARQNTGETLRIELNGPAGIGKSAVARAVLSRVAAQFPGGVYLRSRDEPPPPTDPGQQCLLFIDDAQRPPIWPDVAGAPSVCLITAVDPVWPVDAGHHLVPPLPVDAATRLVNSLAPPGARRTARSRLDEAANHGNPAEIETICRLDPTAVAAAASPDLQDVVTAAIAALPDDVADALPYLGVVEESIIPPVLLTRLLEQSLRSPDPDRFADVLVGAGWALPVDGRFAVPAALRRLLRNRLEATETQGKIQLLQGIVVAHRVTASGVQPEPQLSRDYWTLLDQLSYLPYAEAIAEFIRHRATRPPLTIGLKAQWGAGKTSLMRMIRQELEWPGQAPDTAPQEYRDLVLQTPAKGAKRHRILSRLRSKRSGAESEPLSTKALLSEISAQDRAPVAASTPSTGTAPAPPNTSAPGAENLRAAPKPAERDAGWRPTVWFNPWVYQNGEQVWAGLAHEIIRQITERLPTRDRELFWVRLNLARVDRDAIRRQCYRAVVESLLPVLVTWLIGLVVVGGFLLASWALGGLAALSKLAVGAIGFGTTILAVFGGATQVVRRVRAPIPGSVADLAKPPDLLSAGKQAVGKATSMPYDTLVADPGYGARLGFLHLVQLDMRKVLDLVATEFQPLVVFIDDLDRCSPGTVAQVIEAVNLFLSGEFPNCIFIMGMEPEAVAAHVEAAYKDLASAAAGQRGRSSLGWRFMDKFVQLPVSLPRPDRASDVPRYLRSILGLPTQSAPLAPAAPPPVPTPGGDHAGGAQPGPNREAPGGQDAAAPSLPAETGQATSGAVAEAPQPAAAHEQALSSIAASEAAPDPAQVEAVATRIRRRAPSIRSLPDDAIAAQQDEFGIAEPLLPATRAAWTRVLAELYSDADAVMAIEGMLPAFGSANPRELKRYVNLFRFYTYITQQRGQLGRAIPATEELAKMAIFVIRWPHLMEPLSQLGDGGVPFLRVLERAAGSDDDAWQKALTAAFGPPEDGKPADSRPELRAFLRAGTPIGDEASLLI
jgi:hypothetical protein